MKMLKVDHVGILCLGLFILLGCNGSGGGPKSSLSGVWKGSLTEHGKTTHIKFVFQENGGNPKGKITILSQTGDDVDKGMSFEIMNIEKTDHKLKFIVPLTGRVDRDSLIFNLTLNDNQLDGYAKENRDESDPISVSFTKEQ